MPRIHFLTIAALIGLGVPACKGKDAAAEANRDSTRAGSDSSGSWVIDPGDDTTHTWFDVFDTTGVYLGQVAGPPGLVSWRMTWSGDEMVAYVESEGGEPAVVKYRIQH